MEFNTYLLQVQKHTGIKLLLEFLENVHVYVLVFVYKNMYSVYMSIMAHTAAVNYFTDTDLHSEQKNVASQQQLTKRRPT